MAAELPIQNEAYLVECIRRSQKTHFLKIQWFKHLEILLICIHTKDISFAANFPIHMEKKWKSSVLLKLLKIKTGSAKTRSSQSKKRRKCSIQNHYKSRQDSFIPTQDDSNHIRQFAIMLVKNVPILEGNVPSLIICHSTRIFFKIIKFQTYSMRKT